MSRRKWTAREKLHIVLAGIKRGNISEVCKQYEISRRSYYRWRELFLEKDDTFFKHTTTNKTVAFTKKQKERELVLKEQEIELQKEDIKFRREQNRWDMFLKYQDILDNSPSITQRTTAAFALGEYYKFQGTRFPRMVHAIFKNSLDKFWNSQTHIVEPPTYIDAIYEVIKDTANDRSLWDEKGQNIFNGCRMDSLSFEGFKLLKAKFICSYFNSANFSGADLRGAILNGSDFSCSRFSDANLAVVKMTEADFSAASFRRTCLMSSALWKSDFRWALFYETNLTKAWIEQANFSESWLRGVDFSESICNEKTSFKGAHYTKNHNNIKDTIFPKGFDVEEEKNELWCVSRDMFC